MSEERYKGTVQGGVMGETRDQLMLAIRRTKGELLKSEMAVEHFARHHGECLKALAELRAKVAALDSPPATPEDIERESSSQARIQERLTRFREEVGRSVN